jgi:hypothetical protein
MDDAMQRPSDAASPSRIGTALGWWIAQLVLAVFAYVHMFLSRLSIASCTPTSCDYAQFAALNQVFNVGAFVLLVAAAAGIFVFRHRARVAIWFPVIGILLTAALLIVTYALSRAALDLPLFGNRL